MKSLAVQASMLADDLQIICTGPKNLEILEDAFAKTHEHLEDMGAKLAPNNPPIFSTDAATRDWLRTHRNNC